MRIEYIGKSVEGVIVPDLERMVLPGDVVELAGEAEVEVGRRLLEQADNWRLTPGPSPRARGEGRSADAPSAPAEEPTP